MEDNVFDKIHEVDLKDTMEESYINYAMSVIHPVHFQTSAMA